MHFDASLPVIDPLEPRLLLADSSPLLAIPLKKKRDDAPVVEAKPKVKKAPEITVLLNTQSLADNSASVNFGSVLKGQSAPTRTFTIRNDGKKNLNIGSISLPTGFSLLEAPAAHVRKGKSTTFTVRLDSAAAGAPSGMLSFATNDKDEKTFNFTIRGIVQNPPPPAPAAAPRIALFQIQNGQSIPVTDGSSIIFGTVLKDSSAVRQFQIVNQGNANLTLQSFSIPGGFRLATAPALSIPAGGNTTFSIAMHTSIITPRTGTLTFATNDPKIGAFDIALSGVIVAPATAQSPPPSAPSTFATFSAGLLTITGTAANDSIIIAAKSTGVVASLNGKSTTPFAGVAKIVVNAGAGDDNVSLANVFVNSTLNGGPGHDRLLGSSANDVLNGGDGNDTLIGGLGVDALLGEAGDDLLDAIDGISDAQLNTGTGNDRIRTDRTDPSVL